MPERNSFETVLKWIVLVILAIVALKVAISVLGLAFFLGGFLLFKILPLVLLVWVALKLVEWFRGRNGGPATDPDLNS
ncbi:MAG TPA: hypothetical protein VFR81_22730 [Longimicrobium sp.]|nr:hypothetical protein [Longimicrobium sp.]